MFFFQRVDLVIVDTLVVLQVVVHIPELLNHVLLHVDDVLLLIQLILHLIALVIEVGNLLLELPVLVLCFADQVGQIATPFLVLFNVLLVLGVLAS